MTHQVLRQLNAYSDTKLVSEHSVVWSSEMATIGCLKLDRASLVLMPLLLLCACHPGLTVRSPERLLSTNLCRWSDIALTY